VVGFEGMKDLSPTIYRQRLIIEGTIGEVILDKDIEAYLSQLSDVLEMKTLLDPVTHFSENFGWAGWIHWESSGAHFYTWDEPYPFFSVDIYTCKKFDNQKAVDFTHKFFGAEKIEYRSI